MPLKRITVCRCNHCNAEPEHAPDGNRLPAGWWEVQLRGAGYGSRRDTAWEPSEVVLCASCSTTLAEFCRTPILSVDAKPPAPVVP